MPDWLQTSLANGADPSPAILAWRIGMALVLGGLVAMIYRWARRGEAVQPTFLTTLCCSPPSSRWRLRSSATTSHGPSAWSVPSRSSGSGRSSRTPRTRPS